MERFWKPQSRLVIYIRCHRCVADAMVIQRVNYPFHIPPVYSQRHIVHRYVDLNRNYLGFAWYLDSSVSACDISLWGSATQELESTNFHTLEKLVQDGISIACTCLPTCEAIREVTMRARAPHSYAFADSIGVQMTRPRRTFVRTQSPPQQHQTTGAVTGAQTQVAPMVTS